MDIVVKGIVLGAVALVAAVYAAVELIQYRNVPRPYAAYGERRNKD